MESVTRSLQPIERLRGKLQHIDADGQARTIRIDRPVFSVGRKSINDLVLLDQRASRFHAEIVTELGQSLIRDKASSGGTFVNGERVTQKLLEDGDRIRFGDPQSSEYVFHDSSTESLSTQSFWMPSIATVRQSSELQRLELVLETLRAVHSVRSLDGILKLIVDTTIELTGTERGFIMLKDEAGQLTHRVARDDQKSDLTADLSISNRLADRVFKTGQPVIISGTDMNLSLPSKQSVDLLGLKAIACLPLELSGQMEGDPGSGELHGEIIGVLYVDSRSSSHRCKPDITESLASLVNQAAMVIENARLQRIMHEKRALEKELTLAHQIQQQLLPKELPQRSNLDVASINIPCRNVGGDYFDYMLFDDGRTGVVIGDVSGKGIPAALLMSTLQGIFYAQAFSSQGTAETVTKVNRYLVVRSLENSYLTAFYGVISTLGHLTYTNAGHNPPILVRRDGRIERLTDGGLALGLFDFSDYSSGEVLLEDGDMLVLFSDGVTDAVNEAGEDFGEDRLISIVSGRTTGLAGNSETARAILDRALDEIKSFSNRTDQQDDLTLMVIKFWQAQA